jgi:hypothetical protein
MRKNTSVERKNVCKFKEEKSDGFKIIAGCMNAYVEYSSGAETCLNHPAHSW